ncbi:Helicase associated domain protein [Streptomyces sp. NPDC056231]|uniref:Helicase associated domain protein n=1 Tax=Streptomyces sp. NPDC056231 TaxID=3345755 RepID=UPI003AACB8F1
MIAKWIKFQILDTERQDWTRGYNTARQYFDREGSLDVPYEHQEGTYPLGRWLSDQRRAFRAGTMSSTRADELDELGMIWDTADTAFAENLAAALDLNPTYAWALGSRGQAHRQARRYDQAREDLERALEAEPDSLGCMFERIMLDTVVSGLGACVEQWRQLLASPMVTADADLIGCFDLFKVLILEPEAGVTEATEVFLAGGQEPEVVTDMLDYLAELSAAGDELADRARLCRQLIAERAAV